MDQFDRAQALEMLARDKAIEYQRSKTSRNESLSNCVECGEAISEQRRQALQGVKTCIDCQVLIDKKGKLYATR